MKSYDLCVVGCGYVGLVTGAALAELGHRIVCVDSDKAKIRALRAGRCPIYEPGLAPMLRRNRKAGRLVFTHSIAEGVNYRGRRALVVFIAVGTPPRPDGSADLFFVEAVAAEIAKAMKGYTVIVDKSTVPVETGEWVRKTIDRVNRGRVPYDVVSNPEFLAEGSAVEDTLHPDRIVIGVSSPRAEQILREVYAPIRAPVLVTDLKSAELIKHASNSFLATKISFINAVSRLCEAVGADVELVAKGMGLDRRIGSRVLRAGLGFGGFCFPKDLEAFHWISRQKGYDFKLLETVSEINDTQKDWVLRKVEGELWNLEGKRVAVLGLAFKPNTDDLRFAPSLDIIARLKERRVKVAAFDPVAAPKAKKLLKGVEFARDPYAAAKGADCLVVATEWPQFMKLDFSRIHSLMRTPVILDGRNCLDAAALRKLGFVVRQVGRPG
ncbi:MAG: UDP-glucose/GDP-mannose dehydrogenase family protein [Elusimicrobia bacterium]|nr:UDP-glucose/GDP-mannose dehydrogenase family protein [Elusimicrobiota bacterium]